MYSWNPKILDSSNLKKIYLTTRKLAIEYEKRRNDLIHTKHGYPYFTELHRLEELLTLYRYVYIKSINELMIRNISLDPDT